MMMIIIIILGLITENKQQQQQQQQKSEIKSGDENQWKKFSGNSWTNHFFLARTCLDFFLMFLFLLFGLFVCLFVVDRQSIDQKINKNKCKTRNKQKKRQRKSIVFEILRKNSILIWSVTIFFV